MWQCLNGENTDPCILNILVYTQVYRHRYRDRLNEIKYQNFKNTTVWTKQIDYTLKIHVFRSLYDS